MFFSCWLGVGKKSIFWLWRWSDGLLKASEVLNLHCKIFYNVVCYFYGIRWMSLCISSFYSCFPDSKALKVQHIYSLGEYKFYLERYFGISIVLKHMLKYRSMQVVSWNKTMTWGSVQDGTQKLAQEGKGLISPFFLSEPSWEGFSLFVALSEK